MAKLPVTKSNRRVATLWQSNGAGTDRRYVGGWKPTTNAPHTGAKQLAKARRRVASTLASTPMEDGADLNRQDRP